MPLPQWNDNEIDLLKKITENTAAGGGGGGGIAVQDNGGAVLSSGTINFAGAGVSVTDVGGVATVTIPGGGSTGYPSVANFSALPAAAAHTGETYLVLNAQGTIWLGTRKSRGLYDSNGSVWTLDADETKDYFSGVQPTNGQIPVGNGTVFVTQTVSGDATLAASGAITIANGAVTNAKAADMANSTIKARITAGTGDPEDATAAQVKTLLGLAAIASSGSATDLSTGEVPAARMPELTGDVGMAAGTTATALANDAVTNVKLANMANSTIKARITSGTGDPEDANATQINTIIQGDGSVDAAAGFRNIPQNPQSAAYTAVLADSGKHLLHPSSDANARTFTIPAHGSVPYPAGTAITFVNRTSQVLSIAITTDTLILGGTTTTGTRSLALNGMATAMKITFGAGPDIWIINGTGLT